MQAMAAMQEIIRAMKEIPELPSEKPTDVQGLQKVEFPDKGGVLTYMEGFEHPYKGFPFFEFVEKIDYIKKIQRGMLSSLYHTFRARPWWQKAGLIFVPWLFGDLVRAYIDSFYRMIDRFKLKPIRYCDAMRELHRVFSMEWHGERPEDRELRLKVRDIVCMFLEMDNAYRFRFQDVIAELDKENLRKNTTEELIRLLQLMQSRELTQEVKDTWTLVKTFLPWYLRFNRKLRQTIAGILGNLDLEKIALSVDDKQFCAKRKDYKFGYMELWQQSTSSTKDSAQ